MREWTVIGVPTSAGAHHAGQEQAPAALREAGLIERLREAGLSVADAGDLPGATFATDHDHPSARSLAAVAQVARQVADAVATVVGDGRLPLVVGGDCTITLGVIAGFRRSHPEVGLLYVDGDADVSTPDSAGSGILDAMGVAHLLGHGAPELTNLAGAAPLLEPYRLAMVGGDPREIDLTGRQFLADAGVSYQEGPALAADPAGVAQRALAAVTARSEPLVVHLDVDVVDSGDLPLGNFPHYGSGVLLEHVVACLGPLLAHESVAGLVLTEVNPTHDGDGTLIRRYLDGLISALAGS
ncbi:MAG: arginase [Streptosporangiaceae bacterium]|jgi:arginase|nr:arginase [Streptosporangiaceae bacterium]